MKHSVTSLLLSSLVFSFSAQAGVYKCLVDGKTTFSQRPCGESAEEIEVKYHKPDPTLAKLEKKSSGQDLTADRYIALRKANRRLSDYKTRRAKLKTERDRKLAFWHRETRLIGATASTAGYAMGKAQEIRSIYNEKIQTLDKKINTAERELAAFNAR